MQHLTAVAPQKQHEDDDCIIDPESGVFMTHSRTTIWSKNSTYNNMFLNNFTILLAIMCLISLCFTPPQCSAVLAARTIGWRDLQNVKAPPPIKECHGLKLRGDCPIEHLKNCTVILGGLALTALSDIACNMTDLVFPHLTEITDFLLISNTPRIKTIQNIFPNLVVIRGRRVFTNYGLIINDCNILDNVEFKSLIAIQRGSVLMVNCPKLCSMGKVNFDRLTLGHGNNNIFLNESNACPPSEIHCIGCTSDSCWSNNVCQKFESDSVISPMQDPSECHPQCLGGCYNRTAQGCVVCLTYTDSGTCVSQCPPHKYSSSHHLRCYTREECGKKNFYIHKTECVDFCPVGYQANNATWECDLCPDPGNCKKKCDKELTEFYISNIATAEKLRICEFFNGSIVLDLYEYFDPRELREHFQDLKEITGYLKIFRSPYLTSLNFLQNLEKVHGLDLENDRYAVIIYDNRNLTELWDVKPGLEIAKGGIYIQGNDKLCNRLIRLFRQNIKHDNSLDSVQKSDQEVFCSPAILNLYVQILDHRSISLNWLRDQTYSEVEILYRSVLYKEKLEEKSELDTEVCQRKIWHRELKFAHELLKNSTHYIHVIENLEPHTRYAILVKTFNGDDDTQEGRSEIKYASTKYDIPAPPKIVLTDKTANKLYIEFSQGEVKLDGSPPTVDYFTLEAYDLGDDKDLLDTRDYCDEPAMDFKENIHEDYDDCCSRREKETRDEKFLSQLKHEVACSLDQPQYCRPIDVEYNESLERKMFFSRRFEGWENNYTMHFLEQYHSYVIQMKACNHAGCSSFSPLAARTNYSLTADNIYFSFCRENDTNEYKVAFSEPIFPNGYITSYALHFRNRNSSKKKMTPDKNVLVCVTRLEHQHNKYVYVAHSNYSFNQAAVRVHSLGLHTFVEWKNVTNCSDLVMIGSTKNYFLIGFSIFVSCLLLFWLIVKRRQIIEWLRDHGPVHIGLRYFRPLDQEGEDRHNLVRNVGRAIFFNRSEEEGNAMELQPIGPN